MEEGGDGQKSENDATAMAELDADSRETCTKTIEEVEQKDTVPKILDETKQRNNDESNNRTTNPEEKLCGWLHHRARGLGNFKTTRLRWFQFGNENCKLYIYRDPEDFVPLGEINIATASFYFEAGNTDKQGLFQIRSDGKEFLLDAGSRHSMMHWLQALQTKRREFNLSRGSGTHDNLGQRSSKRTTHIGGLVSQRADSTEAINERLTSSGIPQIYVPESDTCSSNSSLNSLPHTSNKPPLWALNNLKSEIKTKMAGIKFPGRIQKDSECSDSVFYCDLKLKPDSELLSVSTASINSCDSLEHGTSLDVRPRTGTTGSQTSQISRSSQEKESEQHLNVKGYSNTARNTGSWTFLEEQDFISEEGSQLETDNKELPWKPYNAARQQGQGQTDLEPGRSSKVMSALKRIRIGKRQVSEPGPPPRSLSQVSSGSGQVASSKDVDDLEEELKANREIISLLQQKLDEITQEMQFRKDASGVSEEEKVAMIVDRDRQIADLRLELEKYKQDYTATADKLRVTGVELLSKSDQVTMYQDMLKAKDEALISLSEQLQKSECEKLDSMSSTNSFEQPDLVQTMTSRESSASLYSEQGYIRELERYKDICQGYELQHKFLTKEILELTDLRKDDLAREQKLEMDVARLQAKYCQIKSKYYVLLKQQKERAPVREGEDGQEIVNQLLNDALGTDLDDIELRLTGSYEEYDQYGFSRKHFNEEEEEQEDIDPLVSKATALEQQSEELSTKVKEANQVASLRVKWENYLVGRGGKLQKSQELKLLIRQGVPNEFREEVWKGCINMHVGDLREKKGPNYYQELLQKKAMSQGSDPSIKQGGIRSAEVSIELDLLRTLPNNKHYESIESEGIIKLRRVLLAFSEHDRVIGYCQGLNRLAAIALLFLSEEESFWCLVAIVDHILPPEYFSTTLMAAQADQRVLKDLVQQKLPAVHQQLEANKVDLSLFTFNWFLTVFVDNVPTEMFLHIWDTFLYEGSKVLFRFAVAFLKKAEEEILKQEDGLHLNRYLRTIGEKMTNVRQISGFAFNWINSFPMRFLANKRQQHLRDIKEELEELDNIRRGLRRERENSTQDDLYSDDDLDT